MKHARPPASGVSFLTVTAATPAVVIPVWLGIIFFVSSIIIAAATAVTTAWPGIILSIFDLG
jgi:hypothetical protein